MLNIYVSPDIVKCKSADELVNLPISKPKNVSDKIF